MALARDGSRLALLTSEGLVVRGTQRSSTERLVAKLEKPYAQLDWLPGDRFVLVPSMTDTLLVEVATGNIQRLKHAEFAAAITENLVALVQYGAPPRLTVVDRRDTTTPVAQCAFPEGYTTVQWMAHSLSHDVFIASASRKSGSPDVLVLARNCEVKRLLHLDSPVNYTADTDSGLIVQILANEGSLEVIEYDSDGMLRRKRAVAGEALQPIAFRNGRLLVAERNTSSLFEEIQANGVRRSLLTSESRGHFRISPDESKVAWIETIGDSAGGTLRIEPFDDIRRTSDPVADQCVFAAWSPDGTRVVASTTGDTGDSALVVDVKTRHVTPIPITGISALAYPVWVTNERVAFISKDLRTYRWVDLHTGRTGDLIDPTQGLTFLMNRSPTGDISFAWNRRGDGPVFYWIIRPDGQLERTPFEWSPTECGTNIALFYWSHDGRPLYFACDNTLNEVDLGTGRLRPLLRIDGPENASLTNIDVLRDGRVIVQTMTERLNAKVIEFSAETDPH
jgi:hypothetical protein